MAEIPTTEELEELRKTINDLKAADASRVEKQQVTEESIKQQLQSVTGASISTLGQIEQLRTVLADQLRERHQLEGMLRATMNQR